MVIIKSKQKKIESDLKIRLCGKRWYLTKSVKYAGVKLIQILVGNIMLMIFPLNWKELMLFFLKCKIMLVLRH